MLNSKHYLYRLSVLAFYRSYYRSPFLILYLSYPYRPAESNCGHFPRGAKCAVTGVPFATWMMLLQCQQLCQLHAQQRMWLLPMSL